MIGNTAGISYGISSVVDGNMRLIDGSLTKLTQANRSRFFNKVGIGGYSFISAGLMHSNKVEVVGGGECRSIIDNTDGLVTNHEGVFLTVTVADCLPIFFFDKVKKIVGIAHAGWKGILDGIVYNILSEMRGLGAADVFVFIGPHIGRCHFEVKEDVFSLFERGYSRFFDAKYRIEDKSQLGDGSLKSEVLIDAGAGMFIDLYMFVRKQLEFCGVPGRNISRCEDCNYCKRDKYFSYRRDRPKEIEAMVAYIGIGG